MTKDFDTRFTHALLMAIIVLLTLNDQRSVIFGEIGRSLHGPLLIMFCAMWARGMPKLRTWSERRASGSPT